MHFHLPKPLHGWREFAGEVAIIVLGVLIALGAEQLLKTFENRSVAKEVRDEVRAELASNLGKMQSRDRIQNRLDAIAAFLDRARTSPQVAPQWIGRPQFWIMDTAAFSSAGSSARLALLPTSEQMDYESSYSSMANFERAEQDEQAAWAQLRGLAGLNGVSAARDADLRHALQSARYEAWILHVNSVQAQTSVRNYGLRPETVTWGSRSVCIPMSTPFETAVRESGSSDVGEPR